MKLEKLLELKRFDKIHIGLKKYFVSGMIRFQEGDSYWLEYILKDEAENGTYYMDVEPAGTIVFYEMIAIKDIPLEMCVRVNNRDYELLQKGNARIQHFYGHADIFYDDAVEYYEYVDSSNKHLVAIEIWADGSKEYSMGHYLSPHFIF